MKIKNFDVLSSTQQYIKENLNNIEEYSYIVANEQTNGRGRSGNKWISSKDNLMFSFVIKPNEIDIEKYGLITLISGIAMRDTLSHIISDDNFLIKWPNDIIYNDRKVCGIIAEARLMENNNKIIIGIGVNVNQEKFDDLISKKAISLKLIKNKQYDKNEIIILFDSFFKKYLNDLRNKDLNFIDKINNYNYLKNKMINVNNENFKNKIYKCEDITSEGNLKIISETNEIIELNSNEVTLANIYK